MTTHDNRRTPPGGSAGVAWRRLFENDAWGAQRYVAGSSYS